MNRSALLGEEVARIIGELSHVARLLAERGWAEGNAGNLSADLTACLADPGPEECGLPATPLEVHHAELGGHAFLVTGTRTRMRDLGTRPLENACIVRINEDGKGYRILWSGEGGEKLRPTSEFPSHLRIYGGLAKSKARERVVVHTHPTELIALTHSREHCSEEALNRIIWAMHPEVKVFIPRGVGFVPYERPGSEDLAGASIRAFEGRKVVLWEKHGCVAVGVDADQAFDRIEILNKAAKVYLTCRGAGFEPEGLTPEWLNELERIFGSGFDGP